MLTIGNSGCRLGKRTVDVVVGEEKEKFSVHAKLLCSSSMFFDKALSGPWKEASERAVTLPDDKPRAFAIYVHWLYFRTLPMIRRGETTPSDRYRDLIEIYSLGDKLLDPDFQNAILDATIEEGNAQYLNGKASCPDEQVIEYAYSNTVPSSPIRDLLVEIFICNAGREVLREKERTDMLPRSFLLHLARSLMEQASWINYPIEGTRYRIHRKDDRPKRSHAEAENMED